LPIRSSWTTLREYRSALQMLDNDDVSLTESITDRLLEISEEGRDDEFEEGLLEISEEGRDDELTDRSPESFEGGMDDELSGEKGKRDSNTLILLLHSADLLGRMLLLHTAAPLLH
jgi:hypothetical protein